MKIAVLGVQPGSNYYKIKLPGVVLDLYDKERDMRTFDFSCPVITHAPCSQWSIMKAFARPNEDEKQLAFFALKAVHICGGIFEHPFKSSFFRDYVPDMYHAQKVYQSNFGFKAPKPTILYCNGVKLLPEPLTFAPVKQRTSAINGAYRAKTPMQFNLWLINSIITSLYE